MCLLRYVETQVCEMGRCPLLGPPHSTRRGSCRHANWALVMLMCVAGTPLCVRRRRT